MQRTLKLLTQITVFRRFGMFDINPWPLFRTGAVAAARLLAMLIAVLVLASGCRKPPAADIVLLDFESETELDLLDWNCHTLYSLSDEHATSGTKSLRMDLFPSDSPGLAYVPALKDWRAYGELCFDIYNPADHKVRIDLRIDDKKIFPEYADRYSGSLVVKPGANHFIIPLASLTTSGTNRQIDLAHIHRLYLFAAQPKSRIVLYLDALRLAGTCLSPIKASSDHMRTRP